MGGQVAVLRAKAGSEGFVVNRRVLGQDATVVWPRIGSCWKENDPRAMSQRRPVLALDRERGKVQLGGYPKTWCKVERFNGRRGGYTEVCPVPGCKGEPQHIGAHIV